MATAPRQISPSGVCEGSGRTCTPGCSLRRSAAPGATCVQAPQQGLMMRTLLFHTSGTTWGEKRNGRSTPESAWWGCSLGRSRTLLHIASTLLCDELVEGAARLRVTHSRYGTRMGGWSVVVGHGTGRACSQKSQKSSFYMLFYMHYASSDRW